MFPSADLKRELDIALSFVKYHRDELDKAIEKNDIPAILVHRASLRDWAADSEEIERLIRIHR